LHGRTLLREEDGEAPSFREGDFSGEGSRKEENIMFKKGKGKVDQGEKRIFVYGKKTWH